jgi:hypothetical protein
MHLTRGRQGRWWLSWRLGCRVLVDYSNLLLQQVPWAIVERKNDCRAKHLTRGRQEGRWWLAWRHDISFLNQHDQAASQQQYRL